MYMYGVCIQSWGVNRVGLRGRSVEWVRFRFDGIVLLKGCREERSGEAMNGSGLGGEGVWNSIRGV